MPFLFLGASFLSLWIWRDPKIWGTLLMLSLGAGAIAGDLSWIGLLFVFGLFLLWRFYDKRLSLLILVMSFGLKLGLFPGFHPFAITPKFALHLNGPLIGLFPLAFLIPLAHTRQDWKVVLKGVLFGCAGIALLAALAILSGAAPLHCKVPSFPLTRILSNLFLTSIPEEAFYRGWIQAGLCLYFKKMRLGNALALLLTSLLFTASHIFWSPNGAILGFVFLASLLYGSVYLFSGKIESAILCHLLLNVAHMSCFSYHAM